MTTLQSHSARTAFQLRRFAEIAERGGPFAQVGDPVGDAALNRFMRPVALQDAPAWLLERKEQPC